MRRREWLAWGAATLAVTVLVHLVTLNALPRLSMVRALPRIGPPNTMQFSKRPDATSRRVVRPSPDLLYAACPFDLSKGPLRVTARVPHSTYWSVSAFDARTNNFFVRNDRQIAGDSIEIIALPQGMAPPYESEQAPIVLVSPTETGLVLVRLLINDERDLAKLVAIQHQADCATIAAPR
jgi:uncharacterized membrane protein